MPLTSYEQARAFLRTIPTGLAFAEVQRRAVTYRRLHPDPHPVAPGNPSSWKLAAALARRLDAVVPPPLRVQASAEWVYIVHGDDVWQASGSSELIEEGDRGQLLECAASIGSRVMSAAQDEVAHALHIQWPPDALHGMAPPKAEVAGDRVELWFGDRSSPAVVLEPLRLEDFIE